MIKKILYIGGFELPDKNAAAHRVLSVAKALRKHSVDVVFLGVSKDNNEHDVLKTETRIQGFTSFCIPYPINKNEWIHYLTSIDSVKTIISAMGPFDGIICYNYQSIAFARLRQFCRNNKIRIYADCTEWYNTEGNSLLFKIIKGLDIWYRMTILHKKLDGLIVISTFLKQYYSKCKNVIRIPPLIDTAEKKWNIEAAQLKNGINFVYAGQPGNKDRLDEIVTAFYEVHQKYECELWIIGITKMEFLESYPHFPEYLLTDPVNFLGRLSHFQSLSYLKGADCSMIIRDSTRTNNAGFPTKFAEAVTLGVGVIATNISDLYEYSKKIDNVFIVNTSIASTMESFILNYRKTNKINSEFDYRKWDMQVIKLFGQEQ